MKVGTVGDDDADLVIDWTSWPSAHDSNGLQWSSKKLTKHMINHVCLFGQGVYYCSLSMLIKLSKRVDEEDHCFLSFSKSEVGLRAMNRRRTLS